MKRSKFTEAQVAFILRQAEEGTAVGEVCRKAGISEATYYNWRQKSKELPKSAAETAHAAAFSRWPGSRRFRFLPSNVKHQASEPPARRDVGFGDFPKSGSMS